MMRGGPTSNFTPDGKRIKANKGVLKPLCKLMVPHLWMLALCVLCVLLVNAADLAKPYVMEIAIDDFLIGKNAQSGIYSLWGLAAIYFIVIATGSLSSLFQQRLPGAKMLDVGETRRSSMTFAAGCSATSTRCRLLKWTKWAPAAC